MTLSPTDRARIDQLYAPMREAIVEAFSRAQAMLDESEPGRWRIRLGETWRAPSRQMEIYRQGRIQSAPGVWTRVRLGDGSYAPIVTNALPHETPHCVRTQDHAPAAMAVDFAITDAKSGQWAGDKEIVWSVVPCAAWQAAPRVLASGAFFDSPRDWPHVEWRGWRSLVKDGVLIAPAKPALED